MNAHILRLAGRCADGAERDGGSLYHLVLARGRARCGAKPGKRSAGWSSHPGEKVTCRRCLRVQIGACHDPLGLWYVEFVDVEKFEVFRTYHADRAEATRTRQLREGGARGD